MRCGPGGMRDRETNEAESSPGQVPGGSSGPGGDSGKHPNCDGQPLETLNLG